ncbi:bacillithiol biosynthesis BshC, partial [Butyricicoccus sp. 1XD8-22]
FFKNIIWHNEKIAEVVVAKEQLLNDSGYGTPIEANVNNANLFYVRDGERFLLERRNNHFVNDQANVKFTKEELLNIAEQTPENLSNNVVTRPLMQEMTLPVLAFVGGPGELAYWATLKDAFSVLNLQMPIIVPRLNLTIVTRQVEQILAEKQLSVLDVITGKSDHLKRQFIESIQDEEAKKKIDKLYEIIDAKYEDLERHLIEQ